MINVTYAITVCNEFVEIQRLVNFLVKNKRPKDEIVILYDEGNGDPKVEEYLKKRPDDKKKIIKFIDAIAISCVRREVVSNRGLRRRNAKN